MSAPSGRCMNFLYFAGFLFLIVNSGKTTAQVSQVSQVNETKLVQDGNKSLATTEHGLESTTASQIYTTPVKSSTIGYNATTAFEVTTNSVWASTTIESLESDEDDYYDDVTEGVTKTGTNETSDTPVIYTTIPPVNRTQKLDSTTKNETVRTTTIASTTLIDSTTSNTNLTTTTTIASSPKNESRPVSNDTDSNGILSAQIVTDLHIYYKMITPIILRIIFGITVSVTKVKAALMTPTGIAISLFCNFFYMPLSSYAIGWIVFDANSEQRMALYLSGTAATRMMGVFSTCWTMILKGNIELSIVMSIILIICSSIIDSEWLFYTAEQLFNPNNTMEEQGIDLSWYYIGWAICTTIVPFLIGIFAQNICLRLKKPARIFIRRAIYSYILINVIIMTVYTVAKWLQAEHSLRFHVLEFSLPTLRYLTGFLLAMLLQQNHRDCLAIAIEATIPRQNASTSLPMIIHFIYNKIRRKDDDKSDHKRDMHRIQPTTMYRTVPTDVPRVLQVDVIVD